MLRFYHTIDALTGWPSGTVRMVLPVADYGPKARAVVLRPLNPLGFAPVATGTHVTITTSLSMEGR